MIGAAAMAVHGVSRSTRDVDLLVVDPEWVLERGAVSKIEGFSVPEATAGRAARIVGPR